MCDHITDASDTKLMGMRGRIIRTVNTNRNENVTCHGHQLNENVNKMCTFTNNASRSPTYVCVF